MDSSNRPNIEELFSAALSLPASERDSFLRDACASHPRLYHEVRSLLEADESSSDLLDHSAAETILADLEQSLLGRRIGPYCVSALLSTGPMGWVLRADRVDGQFEREVVLKVYPAIGDPQERRRFLAERQILASLDDRNIAHLYEGGTTEEGWPWFAMEEVHGTRITQWCDRRDLGLDARLRLFIQVCRAVESAHRHLVIHCDLKPDNILVDESGTIRLLDFGIARLVQPDRPDPTDMSQRYLTVDYASPEQLQGDALGTASDVFSLGAVLFELLTGAPPFDSSSLDLEELMASRREGPAPASESVVNVAVASRRLRGDLDFILERCLAPSPERRLSSAGELADEIERHLDHYPLRARQHERPYAALRFVRRNRLVLAASTLLLVLGLFTGTHGYRQARTLRERGVALQKERNRVRHATTMLTSMFELADPYSTSSSVGDTLTVSNFLRQNRDRLLEQSDGDPALRAEVSLLLGRLYSNLGRQDDALPLVTESVELFREDPESAGHALADAVQQLGEIYKRRSEYEEARAMFREALARRREAADVPGELVAESLTSLAMILSRADSLDAAIALDEEALQIRMHASPPNPLGVAESLNNLGADSFFLEQDQQSIDYYSRALSMRIDQLGDDHPLVADTRSSLARVYSEIGELEHAQQLYLQALESWRNSLGPDHGQCAIATYNLARIAQQSGDRLEAVRWLSESLRIVETSLPPSHHWRSAMTKQLDDLLTRGSFDTQHP